MGNAAFLAQQIALVQRAVGRPFDSVDPAINADATNNVAAVLDSYGLADIRNLRYYENQSLGVMFFFDIASGKVISNPVTLDQIWSSDPKVQKLVGYYRARFDTYWIYCVVREGFPIFYAAKYHNENEWQTAFHVIAGLVAIGVTAGFAGLAVEIGSAVLGPEMAASYPALAQGIGNAAIGTALNGGDVQSAVVGAVSGGLGGAAGGFVASATDSAIIGAAAGAATKAAITGGDIESAALQSLAYSGVNAAGGFVSSQLSTPTVTPMDDSDLYGDFSSFIDDSTAPLDYHDPVYSDDSATPNYATDGYHDPVWSVNGSPEGASLAMPGVTSPPAGPTGIVATGSDGSSLTQLALMGLKLLTSWNQAGQPAVRTANVSTRPNANGTLTNLATGQTVTMPKGTPYLLPNGSLVTNNGDGTYTTVSATGQVSTTAYVGTTIFGGMGGALGSIPPVVLWGGAALLLVALTGSRRSA